MLKISPKLRLKKFTYFYNKEPWICGSFTSGTNIRIQVSTYPRVACTKFEYTESFVTIKGKEYYLYRDLNNFLRSFEHKILYYRIIKC